MTNARDRVHLGHCGELGHCLHVGGYGGEQCDALSAALDQVEDDHAHRQAELLRQRAKLIADPEFNSGSAWQRERESKLVLGLAALIDPYEERDGTLVRKSDGKPVTL